MTIEKEKSGVKINIIDILIILIFIGVCFFIYSKMHKDIGITGSTESAFTVKFYATDIDSFVTDSIKVGDKVLDADKELDLGQIIDIKSGDSISFSPNSNGILVASGKENHNSIEITSNLKGQKFDYGFLVNGNKYSVGHSLNIRAGKAILNVRISGIEEKSGE